MKNILIISEVYKKGGAGNATNNIFEFFNKNFNNVNLLIPLKKNSKQNIYSYYNNFSIISYLLFKLINRVLSFFLTKNKFYFYNKFFDLSLFKAKKIRKKIYPYKPDIIIILWFEYILNYKEILKIKKEFNAEIILFPFDMFYFTGGCRYSQMCSNFEKDCKQCPALIKLFDKIPNKNYLNNKKIIKEIMPKIFLPSSFACQFVKDTNFLSNSKIETKLVNYPVEISKKKSASNLVNKIKSDVKDKKIIFLGAQDLREWRKGIHNFVNVISILNTRFEKFFEKLVFIVVGKDSSKILKDFKKNTICIDNLKHSELYEIYKMSDLIIIPSLQEWGSLMMSEAITLNKVVFAFDTGSSRDLITNNYNGFIFRPYDYSKIVSSIYSYINDPENFLKKKNQSFVPSMHYRYDEESLKLNYHQSIFK